MTRNARWGRRVLGAAFAAGAAFGLGACEPEGIDLVVNTPVDGSDADPGDGTCEMTPGAGDCSLRAAIDEANALPDHEVITFDAAVTAIELAVPGPGEDANASGDLDITDGVTIDGGEAGVTVDGAALDRVFDVHGGADPAPFVTLRRLTITGGDASEGGGVRLAGAQHTSILESLVTGNQAEGDGGGVSVGAGASTSLHHTTLSANAAGGAGSALWSTGTATLAYSTVADTTTGDDALHRDGSATGPLNLMASVIGRPREVPACGGAVVTSLGGNVAADGSCALGAAGDQPDTDPQLGDLADHGGPTATHLPAVGSPAVDAVDETAAGCGNLFPADARGTARPQHGDCDAGAVELGYTPMAVGNGTNYLGTGDDPADILPTELHENRWLAITGPCGSAENGDILAAITDANYSFSPGDPAQNPGPPGGSPTWNRCTGSDAEGSTEPNPDHDPNGYFYAVDVPEALAGSTVHVDGFDLSHCSGTGIGDSSASTNDVYRFTTRYRLRSPDGTPAVPEDNPLVPGQELALSSETTTGTCATPTSLTTGGYRNGWRRLFTIAGAQPGTYFVQVSTESMDSTPATAYHGTNAFGLRVAGGAFTPCSAAAGSPIHDPACPVLSAPGWLGSLQNLSGLYPSFGLGSLDEAAAGGALQVEVFDPGEGAWRLELLDPVGRSMPFDWRVVDRSGSDVAPTGGWIGTVTQPGDVPCGAAAPDCQELDLLGTPNTACATSQACYWRGWNPQPGPYRGSRSKYSDRLLELTPDLPGDLDAEYGDARLLHVRYHLTPVPGASTDRVAWRTGVWESTAS